MKDRNEYALQIHINGRELNRVIIDQHYKIKHPEVTDEIVLDLVRTLNGKDFVVESEIDHFQYFTAEPVFHDNRPYRVVMVLCIYEDYLGVINAFRVNRSKHE